MNTRIKEEPKRYCRFCGARLHRKRFNGRLEDLGVFNKRKYCDQRCMAEGMVQESVSKATHHYRARQYRKDACETCSTADKLHVHHRDGDWRNNTPDNLATLCGSCHLKAHWQTASHQRQPRVYVLKQPFEELLTVCEELLDELGDSPLTSRLQEALVAVRNPLHHPG